ncbi:MAG: hypothetical protein ACNA7J_01570 [Wenzhouxiangella sp.]
MGVQRREVDQAGTAGIIFAVPGIPAVVQIAPQPGLAGPGFKRLATESMDVMLVPGLGHASAIDQHDRGVAIIDGKKSGLAHVKVEKLGRIGQVDLVDVVVDRPALEIGVVGDGEAIVGETGQPEAALEPLEIPQQVDFINPGRVAVFFDRPQENPLSPKLTAFGTEKDSYRRLVRCAHARFDAEDDAIRCLAPCRRPVGAEPRRYQSAQQAL